MKISNLIQELLSSTSGQLDIGTDLTIANSIANHGFIVTSNRDSENSVFYRAYTDKYFVITDKKVIQKQETVLQSSHTPKQQKENQMTTSKISFDSTTSRYSFTLKNGKVRSSVNKSYIMNEYERDTGDFSMRLRRVLFDTPIPIQNLTDSNAEHVAELIEDFNINERFDFIANFVTMVADKIQPSMIVTGPGGLGKSTIVNKTLHAEGYVDVTNIENFPEGSVIPLKHYRSVKGFSTPKALFRLLYENKDSILVFDDCDNILLDSVSTNLLKGALDSSAERIISWNAEPRRGDTEEQLPRSFRFTGGVIFISNLNKEKFPQALMDRSIGVDVSMTLDQKIERITKIAHDDDFMPEAEFEIKMFALEMINKYKNVTRDMSMRSLIKVVRIGQKYSGEKFENLSKYALMS